MKKMICLMVFVAVILAGSIVWAFNIPDTGQIFCYNNTQEIYWPLAGDAFYGQDAQYAGNARSYTKLGYGGIQIPDTPSPGGITATWLMTRDNVTGLVWQIATEPVSSPGVTWNNAYTSIAIMNSVKYAGFSDWRLPTVRELSSLVNYGIHFESPVIDSTYFPNTVSYWYWSSTSGTGLVYGVWAVNFINGFVDHDSANNLYQVRAVRGGQPAQSMVDNQDGTITDPNTGLMWQKETIEEVPWELALFYAENLELAGYSDWRLPNMRELQSIVDYSRTAPCIDPVFAATTQSNNYWSSSTYMSPNKEKTAAWHVVFYGGEVFISNKANYQSMRAVRGGNTTPVVQIGTEPGNIQKTVSANQVVDLMINSTNIYGNVALYEWFLLTGNLGGVSLPVYVISDTGVYDFNDVSSNLDAYTFSFDTSFGLYVGVTYIGRMSMSDLGLSAGDTLIYGYAFMNTFNVIHLDNIVSITVE
jgi:hypothetical protein